MSKDNFVNNDFSKNKNSNSDTARKNFGKNLKICYFINAIFRS